MRGTAEENEAIVHGSFAFFGTYSVANGVIVQHIEGGTWPAWTGTDQKRTILSFKGDEQSYNLTPTELRVMLAVVEVGGVPEVAEALRIGSTTVKTHLGRIYGKTGTRRQADLVKLVAGSSVA